MNKAMGLGRVAVVDAGESGRRALRAIHELTRAGQASAAVAVCGDRLARFVREADESVELEGSLETALRTARVDSAWLGRASLSERAAFAETCTRVGVTHIGPPTESLHRLCTKGGMAELATRIGIPVMERVPSNERAHFIEVVTARDKRGAVRALGVGDASLRLGEVAVLTESMPPLLGAAGDGVARDLATRACEAANWVGICSVQLLFDAASRRFAFIGLDAYAQSAPAVEALAGVDLVRLALQIATGSPLGEDNSWHGHAFAARILAGDPSLSPGTSPGPVEMLCLPSGLGVRADTVLGEGDEPAGPESVLATVVARGATRAEAAQRLEQALADSDVLLRRSGSSKAWLLALCARPEVKGGEAGIQLLDSLAAAGQELTRPQREAALLAAAIQAYHGELDLERARFVAEAKRGRARVGPSSGRTIELRYGGLSYRLEVKQTGPRDYRISTAGEPPTDVQLDRLGRLERRLLWQGRRYRVLSASDGLRLLVQVDGVAHAILRDPSGVVISPMPAVVVAIPVQPGQRVAAGERVAWVESMKVEVEVTAPVSGTVREVLAAVNGQVDAGAPLVRIEPEGQPLTQSAAEPLALHGDRRPQPAGPSEQYLSALDGLRQLLLGFDMATSDAKTLASGWRAISSAVPPDDPEILQQEEWALSAFADIQVLFSRARSSAEPNRPPPMEELWHYLHEPEARGAGLSPAFVAMLKCALAHYGVPMEAQGRALELALLRAQKAHERAHEQLPLILSIMERRLAGAGEPRGFADEASRELLDRLAELGRERFPALSDLAREARYRRFEKPALDRLRADAYAQAEEDLDHLANTQGEHDGAVVERLVACPQPLATMLLAWMVTSAPVLRPRLIEILLRRYYRFRSLEKVTALESDGLFYASSEYQHATTRSRVMACFATTSKVAQTAYKLAQLAREVPPDRELVVELYLWQDGPEATPDQVAESLQDALTRAGFGCPVRRASVLIAMPGKGLGRHSQQHFTFSGGPGGFAEERRYRDVHPMLFERMQMGRLSKFSLERLPSGEEIYLYRGVAQSNPKDERLFAMAEVRDLTSVRDANGRVQYPHFERLFREALAGMRLFQSRRPPHQRLEWNRILLTVTPPFVLSREDVQSLASRLAPDCEGLGLEMVLIHARVPHEPPGELRERVLRVVTTGSGLSVRWDDPMDRPLEPLSEYHQKVVQLRRRGLTHPFELVRMLAPPTGAQADLPHGEFVEYDLDASNELVPVQRPPGRNSANIVVGVITSFTDSYPEGMKRVALLSDPGREMGSVAEPECRRIIAGLDLAEQLGVPLEWFEVCAGAKISMTSGTENMDWISSVLRRLIEFTQAGGEINVVVLGITVGAQPYWNAEATMLMHTRGILVMGPGSSMVLTGKQALEYSGSVSAEDNEGIGGYERIMGPNGQAQYNAASVAEAIQILMRHYEHAYVARGERFPRRAHTADPRDRDVRSHPHGPEGGAGFTTVGDIFSNDRNPDRKKPFEIRYVMAAAVDQDHPSLERWRDWRGGDTAVIWDAHLGGWPICLIGIQSRPLPRCEFVPADGPEFWSAGTLFPQSSKKIARTVNSASGKRPLVVLANLSGFDGSPESMRRLQLEYGAEIGRSVVNFKGPIVFCVVSRYHGGAFVVFAKTLTPNIEIAAVEGARASVIGGAPAAAVVFAREVESRTKKDPRVVEAEKAAAAGGDAARVALAEIIAQVRSRKLGEVGDEFDKIHSVERALKVHSLDRIIAAKDLRPYLIDALERGISAFVPVK